MKERHGERKQFHNLNVHAENALIVFTQFLFLKVNISPQALNQPPTGAGHSLVSACVPPKAHRQDHGWVIGPLEPQLLVRHTSPSITGQVSGVDCSSMSPHYMSSPPRQQVKEAASSVPRIKKWGPCSSSSSRLPLHSIYPHGAGSNFEVVVFQR